MSGPTLHVVPIVEPIMMTRVQPMIKVMLAEQTEEIIQLFQENKRYLTTPIVEIVINNAQSEEGSYCKSVKQTEPRKVRRNNIEEEIDKNGCSMRTSWHPNHKVFLENQHQ